MVAVSYPSRTRKWVVLNNAATVNRVPEHRESIDESDPASMRHAVRLGRVPCPALFSGLVEALASAPAERPAFVSLLLLRAPDLPVL